MKITCEKDRSTVSYVLTRIRAKKTTRTYFMNREDQIVLVRGLSFKSKARELPHPVFYI